jgi:two-component system OmpR family sensor kinase/two-component system sensor histidine kinase QseC
MTRSIRVRLLITLLATATAVSLLAGFFTYRQVLAQTSELFDYQLREVALSLRSQVALIPRIEIPPEQGDQDLVVQIWDLLGATVYRSRPGLPVIDEAVLDYADLNLQGEPWRVYGLRTVDGIIQVAQPVRVRETFARRSALRVVIPVLLLVPILGLAIIWVVSGGLLPVRRVVREVKQRDARSLTPLATERLPEEILPLVEELNRLLARLERAFATQRAFIADAAHELRSPLTAVRLQLQLLDRAPDEPSASDARMRLGEAVDRAAHLIEQLLTLARNEPQDVRDELRPISLRSPVAEAIADTHALAQARRIDLQLEADERALVLGDGAALRTLARNLVDNAVRYTPEGGKVRVEVSASETGERLVVTDTGPGIPAADRERAFDRFYRRVHTGESGTGLGLAIVKAIADRHRATVTLEPGTGGGLRVVVAFPSGDQGPSRDKGPS